MRRRAPAAPDVADENLRMHARSALIRLSFMPGVIVDRLKIIRSASSGEELHAAAVALHEAHDVTYPPLNVGPRRTEHSSVG